MKMCEQILKKKTAPQYNSNSLNCNKIEQTNVGRIVLEQQAGWQN